MGESLFTNVLIVISFMSVAVVASLGVKRINFPYTIGLVLIGLGVGWLLWSLPELADFRNLSLSSELILYIILPILIFEASLNIDARLLFKNIVPISLLAVVGLLISTAVVALGLHWLTSMSIAGALLFGALISATDPVAVIALFKEIGAPKRLVTLIDGESLFNDATAIVLFTVVAAAIGMNSAHGGSSISVFDGAVQFVLVLVGGLAVGASIGFLGSYLIQFDKGNFLFQMTVSIIMAYLSFLVADHFFHFSGVMSSLGAGLVLRFRSETAFKRHHIKSLEEVWEFFSFVANSFIFILLGMTAFDSVTHQGNVMNSLVPVLWSLPIVLLARFLSVYLLIPPYNLALRVKKKPIISGRFQLILLWGGLRGAVPVALVLAIPPSFPERDLILHLTFGIILFTLLIQGTTVKKIMEWLGIKPDTSPLADRPTVETPFHFPSVDLAVLIAGQVRKSFEAEGYQSIELSEVLDEDLAFKKGNQIIEMHRRDQTIELKCEPSDVGFIHTLFSEALLSLKSAMETMQNSSQAPSFSPEIDASGEYEDVGNSTPFLKLLKPENILLNLEPGSKEEILKKLLDHLTQNGEIDDPKKAIADINEREKSMTTGLGHFVATPHAKTDAVKHLAIAIGVCKLGTDFRSFDGQPTKFFALLVSPKTEEGPYLQVLSMVTGLFRRGNLQAALMSAHTRQEAYQAIRSHALSWRTSNKS